MRFLGLGPATLLVFLISYSISHGNRIDPAGIKGNFVLSADINNQDAIDEFTRLAGEDSNILLLDLDVSNELKTDNKLLVRESLDVKILSIGQNLNGFILILDLLNLNFRKVKLKKLKNVPE